jgi:hypothetical protein
MSDVPETLTLEAPELASFRDDVDSLLSGGPHAGASFLDELIMRMLFEGKAPIGSVSR